MVITETHHNETSFCLVGIEKITSILQKTPSRVLHLVPELNGGWQIEEEFKGAAWNIRQVGREFFVYNSFNAGGRVGGNCSHPYPAFDTSRLN